MIQTYPEMNKKIVKLLEMSEDTICFYAAQRIRELEQQLASQSAKPGQAHIPASPCPADTLNHNTPNSRHPGAKDCEVNDKVIK